MKLSALVLSLMLLAFANPVLAQEAPACPCFEAADLDAAYLDFSTWTYQYKRPECYNYYNHKPGQIENNRYAYLRLIGVNSVWQQSMDTMMDQFYTYGWDFWKGPAGTPATYGYCTHLTLDRRENYVTGQKDEVKVDDFLLINSEEVDACRKVVLDWVNAHGMTCTGPTVYWPDADGDGYGNPAGATEHAPKVGFVTNDQDCNDADAAINPGVEEFCNDDLDNNCNGEIDEFCCPCFTAEDIDAAYLDFATWVYQYKRKECYNYYNDKPGQIENCRYTYVRLNGNTSVWRKSMDTMMEQFYTYGWDFWKGPAGTAKTYGYCTHLTLDTRRNYVTGQTTEVKVDDFQLINSEEVDICRQIVLDWTNAHSMTCYK
jgi:hypothetical protein